MNEAIELNNATVSSQASVTKTVSYSRSENIQTTQETLRENDAETQITTKTTTRTLKEITRTRRELESKIQELNNELKQIERSEAEFRIEGDEDLSVKFIDENLDLALDVIDNQALNRTPQEQSGLLFDTVA